MIKLDKFSITKIQEKLKSDNKMILLVILASFILLYLDFTFLMKLQLSGIKKFDSKIAKLKKDFTALERDLLSMQDFKNKQKAMLEVKKIISEEYTASLFQEVSDLANKNKVKIMQMKPEKASQAQKQAKESLSGNFTLFLINLDLLCDYHHLGKFINDLENAQTFIVVQNIKITSQPADFFIQKVSLVLKTYVKK